MDLPLSEPDVQGSPAPRRDVYTVSRLTREVRALLERSFGLLWVEGEISNLSRPNSGHLYFSLKDRDAQVRCAMFRQRNQFLSFNPADGAQVLARVRIGLYEPRGDFQLVVEHLEPAGDGLLRRAFEDLKKRLSEEGLFDPGHKKPLPRLPRCIGVVTSPTGAAIRDILSVLRRRFPAIEVLIYPVPVQGPAAAPEIARMIRLAGRRRDCDVLLVGRGGGSLEDLWAFNEEVVARAIYDSPIPVVSGVGHEIDVTIADFVADKRAATPSAAAECVSPDGTEWLKTFVTIESRLCNQMRRRQQQWAQALDWLDKRLAQRHPGRRLQDQHRRLTELEQRLRHAWRVHLRHDVARLYGLTAQLGRHDPSRRLLHLQVQRENLDARLTLAMTTCLRRQRQQLSGLSRALDAVSPLATLGRGYAIVKRLPDGAIVRSAQAVNIADRIEVRIADGRLTSRVEEKHET